MKQTKAKKKKGKKSVGTFFKWLLKNFVTSLKENYIAIIIITAAMICSAICQSLGVKGWFITCLNFLTGQSATASAGFLGKSGALMGKIFLITAILNFVIPFIKKLFSKNKTKTKSEKGSLKALIDKIVFAGMEQIGFIVCGFGAALALYEFLTLGGGAENSFVIILTILSLVSILLTRANSILTSVSKFFKLTPINNAPVFSVTAGLSLGLTFGFVLDAFSKNSYNLYMTALTLFLTGIAIIVIVKLVKRFTRVKVLLENFAIFLAVSAAVALPFVGNGQVANALTCSFDETAKATAIINYLNDEQRPTELTFLSNSYFDSDVTLQADTLTEAKKIDRVDNDWVWGNTTITKYNILFSLNIALHSDLSQNIFSASYTASAERTAILIGSWGKNEWAGNCDITLLPTEKEDGTIALFAKLTFDIPTIDDNAGTGNSTEYFKKNFLGGSTDGTMTVELGNITVISAEYDFVTAVLYPTPTAVDEKDITVDGNAVSVSSTLNAQQYALFDSEGGLVSEWKDGNGETLAFTELDYDTQYTVKTRTKIYNGDWGTAYGTIAALTQKLTGGTSDDSTDSKLTQAEAVTASVAEGLLTTLGATVLAAGLSAAASTAASATSSAAIAAIGSSGGSLSMFDALQLFLLGGGKQAVKGVTVSVTRVMKKKQNVVKKQLDKARKNYHAAVENKPKTAEGEKMYNELKLKIFQFMRYFPIAEKLSRMSHEMCTGKRNATETPSDETQTEADVVAMKLAANNNNIIFAYSGREQLFAAEMFNTVKFSEGKDIAVDDIFSTEKKEDKNAI